MKVVINKCYGGFGLSDAAYAKLIEWGVPVRKYVKEERDEQTGLYKDEPLNDGEIIFDRELTPKGEDDINDMYYKYPTIRERYWECWIRQNRTHPLLVRVVEELGEAASGRYAKLKVVDVPDGVDYEIDEYDGIEHIAEKHRTWG
jgi:hypothetical protein